MSKTTENPVQNAPQGHHHDELAEVKQLIEKHGKPVVTGILVVMVAVVVIQLSASRKESNAKNASNQFATAQSIPDLEDILENYGKTPIAPLALLSLAKRYYDNANYEIALTKYDEFIQKHKEDRMRPTAELGRIFCIEARNNESALTEAAAAYAAFAQARPDHALTAQAIFGQARCLEQLGQNEEARVIYEEFIANNADSPWVGRAEEALQQVTRTIEDKNSKTASMPKKDVTPPPAAPVTIDTPVVIAPAAVTPEAAATAPATLPAPAATPAASDGGK